MKKHIHIFFSYMAYWYILFVAARVSFLIFYFDKSLQISINEIINTFIYGFKLDIAIAAYISILPSLLLTFSSFFNNRFIKIFYQIYSLIAILLCSTIILGDLFMYKHWAFRLDATPLFYMTNLKAMTASVSTYTLVGGIIAIIGLTALLYFLFQKIFSPLFDTRQKNSKAFFVLLPATLLLIILIRGGIGVASLSTSTAYFSKNQFANHAAINPIWNVGFSISESNDLKREYKYYSESEMKHILAPLYAKKGNTISLLKTTRPNIILIITESLTAKAIEATGGHKGIMPELNQLIKEGVLFNQIYAASDRTDRGLAAVLAGYPSLPGSSPLKYQKLTGKLAYIPQKLNEAGYKSELYYGGTLTFANYQSFLTQAGYDKMVSDKDFVAAELISKWGAFDHTVLNRCLKETPDEATRFFKTILTLTSHEPFITPVEPVFKGNDDDTKYLNSLHYTDMAIGDFIRESKKRKWWSNTLVIIIADHGSSRPDNSAYWEKSMYHIPMIWLGGVLSVADTVIQNHASQTDLAATLLSQLNINTEEFMFSKNILNTNYLPFSFFTYNGGFGFQKPGKSLIYNTVTNTYDEALSDIDSTNRKQGKAYLESIYLDFLSKNK